MIHFQLVSSSGIKFDEDVYEALIPTQGGVIAVFADHMPLIGAAATGVLSLRKKQTDSDHSMEHFAVSGGIVQIDGKSVRFLADEATTPDEISKQEASAALERARQLMGEAKGQVAMTEAKRSLHHSTARLQVSRLKKRHHH